MNSTLEILNRWDWQAFVTPTFRRLPGPLIEQRMLFAWLRKVGRVAGRRHPLAYPWVVRRELGEAFGRPHFHALIGDLPGEFVRRFVLQARSAAGVWWQEFGGGNVRTRACSATGAAEYLSESCGMDAYEMGKFRGEYVIFGNYALGLSCSRSRVSQRAALKVTRQVGNRSGVNAERLDLTTPVETDSRLV